MSLDPQGSIRIDRQDFWATPIWRANLQTNTRKERQVSFNEDLLTYIQGLYEKNPNTKEKSNRYGGWQTNTDFYYLIPRKRVETNTVGGFFLWTIAISIILSLISFCS